MLSSSVHDQSTIPSQSVHKILEVNKKKIDSNIV